MLIILVLIIIIFMIIMIIIKIVLAPFSANSTLSLTAAQHSVKPSLTWSTTGQQQI